MLTGKTLSSERLPNSIVSSIRRTFHHEEPRPTRSRSEIEIRRREDAPRNDHAGVRRHRSSRLTLANTRRRRRPRGT